MVEPISKTPSAWRPWAGITIRSAPISLAKAQKAFLRGLFALFGALLGGVGLFWPLVDGAARAMHDKVSGTTVVRAGSGRPAGANAG